MNKRELVDAMAAKAGIEKTNADAALDALVDTITTALAEGDKVTVPGFGTFEVRERSARSGRNPQSGEPMQIAASKGAAFKPAAALKRTVNAG
jgi:DNA-binding protein HU-beta